MTNPIPVFDIGGVLIHWDPHRLYRQLIDVEADRRHFVDRIFPADWDFEQDGRRSFAEGLAERIAPHPEKEDLITAFDRRWIETIAPIDGTVAILEELRNRGTRTFAISNFSREKFLDLRLHFPVLDRFDGIVVSGNEGLMKPDRRIYDLLCRRYGLDAGSCLFIDDNLENVDGARRAGMRGHLFTTPEDLRTRLKDLGLPPA